MIVIENKKLVKFKVMDTCKGIKQSNQAKRISFPNITYTYDVQNFI